MNRLVIIGNLTHDPELRSTTSGISVCTFTVAVNRRGRDQGVDYFRVTAWRELGELCSKFLMKGRKVCVVGSVSVNAYQTRDGKANASLEVTAQEVEFLSPAGEAPKPETVETVDAQSGFEQVETNDLPF